MKTQEALWIKYERLKAEERWEEALRMLDLIEPISDEEWFKKLAEAPLDDEPLSADERLALDEARAALDRAFGQHAG